MTYTVVARHKFPSSSVVRLILSACVFAIFTLYFTTIGTYMYYRQFVFVVTG